MLKRAICALAALALAAPLGTAQDHGPDAFGYFANDIPANFLDISGTGLDVTGFIANLDDGGVVLPLGFAFSFYGSDSPLLSFCTNGYLADSSDLTDFTNDCPMADVMDPNRGIFPYFGDLRLTEHGSMHFETLGASPNQVFIAQWTDAGTFATSGAHLTFQARIFEDGAIEYHYDELTGDPGGLFDPTGGQVSVGLENDDGTVALEIVCNNSGVMSTATGYRIELGAAPPAAPPQPDYGFTTIAPNFTDISGTGTDITSSILNLDDGGVVVPVGFGFNFYGTSISSIGFTTNGYLTDGPDLTDFTADCPMPNPIDPNRGIYPYFADLRLTEHGQMLHQTFGLAPSRVFIAQWEDVGSFDDTSTHLTMQVKLMEGCNEIEFHYDLVDSGTTGTFDATGGEGAVGVEGTGGTIATTIGCNVPGTVSTTTAYRLGITGVQVPRIATVPNAGTLTPDPAPGAPKIGTNWAPTVSGPLTSLFDVINVTLQNPIDVALPFGSLVCPINTTLLQTNFAPGTPFSIPFPPSCSLVGLNICTQGAQIQTGPLVIGLTNGLDIIAGSI